MVEKIKIAGNNKFDNLEELVPAVRKNFKEIN